jgi:hypothetical protein
MPSAFADRRKPEEALGKGLEAYDEDNDGWLSLRELGLFVRAAAWETSAEFVLTLFLGLDVNGERFLAFDTVNRFFKALADKWDDVSAGHPPLEVLAVWFRASDVRRTGTAAPDDLKAVLQAFETDTTALDAAANRNIRGIKFDVLCKLYGLDQVPVGADPWSSRGGLSSCCLLL